MLFGDDGMIMTWPGVEAWIEHTTSAERVRAVILTASQPQTAGQIAEEAVVPVEDARDHLEDLVNRGILLENADREMSVYWADPDYTRSQTIQELLDTHDEEELVELRDDLLNQVEMWKSKYNVENPAELRESLDDTKSSAKMKNIRRTVYEWELIEYRLDVLTDITE